MAASSGLSSLRGSTGCGKTLVSRIILLSVALFRALSLFRSSISVVVLPPQAVFSACGDTSALAGHRLNRNESPHAHQVISRDGQPIEPVHSLQTTQLDLPHGPIQLAPSKDSLDQLASLLADSAPFIAPFVVGQSVFAEVPGAYSLTCGATPRSLSACTNLSPDTACRLPT